MKVDIRYKRNSCHKNIKWQQVRIKIHQRDLWSGDTTLAHIIHAFLIEFAKEELRPTMVFYPDNYHEIEDDAEREKIEKDAEEKWKNILNDMIYAFYWIKTDSTFGPHAKEIHKELDQARKDKPEKDRFDNEVFKNVFEKWDSLIEEHEKRIKEGTKLFGIYFQSLWT